MKKTDARKSVSAPARRPSALRTEIATRARSIDFTFFGGFLPNPDPILKKMGKDQEVYEEIMGDGHLTGIIATRTSGVKKLMWEIDRGTNKGAAKSEQAKTIEATFHALDMDQVISEILEANYRGYQPLEVNWAVPDLGGLILPEKVVGKPPEWFQFDEENQLRFRTLTNLTGEELPPRKFLLPRRKASFKNPYGEALLSKCYWPAVFKRSGLKFWVIFTEKYGIPYAVGKVPRGAAETDFEEMKNMLQNMVQDAVAAIPDDSSVEIMEASGKSASAEIFEKLVAWANAEMSKVIVGHGSGADSTPGKLGSEDNAQEVKEYLVEEDKRLVEATLNTLIKWIYEINWGAGDVPVFSLYREEDVDDVQANRDKTLSDQGVELSQAYYEREYGFQPGDIVKVSKPEKTPPPGAAGLLMKPKKGPAFADRPRGLDKDHQALEDFIDGLSAKEMQEQAEGMLRPVIAMIEKATSYEDILDSLARTYKDMDSKNLEKMLQRAIFVSETLGRANADA